MSSTLAHDWVLRAEGLSKHYHTYPRPRARLWALARRVLGRPPSDRGAIRALQEVDLHLEAGGALAVIGPNGAGKSTLLRLAAGIATPSAGRVEGRGAVATLLELDWGFHPHLDALENVRMAARLEGLGGAALRKRVDAALALADLGTATARPFRSLSRGMQLRLGFALAVTGEPDLLIVDEALSVGDESFRIRCIERLRALRGAGTALLFVSHDLAVVRALADRVLLLDQGRVAATGRAAQVVDEYLARAHGTRPPDAGGGPVEWGEGDVRLSRVRVDHRPAADGATRLRVVWRFEARRAVAGAVFGVGVARDDGAPLTAVNHHWHADPIEPLALEARAQGEVTCELDLPPLAPGTYRLSIYCYDHAGPRPRPLHHLEGAHTLEIPGAAIESAGPLAPPNRWSLQLST